MNATVWDIVSDVFPGVQVVENKDGLRRATRVPSSIAVAVVFTVCAAIAPAAAQTCATGGVSSSSFIQARERIVRKPPGVSRASSDGVDFATGRSAEQLARSFQAFFRPAVDHDEEDQVPYVFN